MMDHTLGSVGALRCLSEDDTPPNQMPPIIASSVVPLSSQQSSSQDSEEENLVAVTGKSFRMLGISFLFFQILAAIVFSWYSWHVQNYNIGLSALWITDFWIFLAIWKITIAYYEEQKWLFQLSSFTFLLSANPWLQYSNVEWSILVVWPFLMYAYYWAMDQVSRSMNILLEDQDKRNQLAMSSLNTSMKVGIIMVYLQAEVLALISSTTRGELLHANDILLQANATWREQEQAQTLFDDNVEVIQAAAVGLAMNHSILFGFVLLRIATLTMADVMTLQLTWAELALFGMTVMIVLDLVILLALAGSIATSTFANWAIMMSIAFAAIVTALVSCGLIARSILQGRHPYINHRFSRCEPPARENEEGSNLLMPSEGV